MRVILVGEDNFVCIFCWSFIGFIVFLFEVVVVERRFYSFFNCIFFFVVYFFKELSKNRYFIKVYIEIDL